MNPNLTVNITIKYKRTEQKKKGREELQNNLIKTFSKPIRAYIKIQHTLKLVST